jgi:hypothetical protein
LSFSPSVKSTQGSEGYSDGYERGFSDAATRNCAYWGETHNEISDNLTTADVIAEIPIMKK